MRNLFDRLQGQLRLGPQSFSTFLPQRNTVAQKPQCFCLFVTYHLGRVLDVPSLVVRLSSVRDEPQLLGQKTFVRFSVIEGTFFRQFNYPDNIVCARMNVGL